MDVKFTRERKRGEDWDGEYGVSARVPTRAEGQTKTKTPATKKRHFLWVSTPPVLPNEHEIRPKSADTNLDRPPPPPLSPKNK